MAQKPSVGRIVHVFWRELDHIGPYAAIVTSVHDDGTTINGTLFSDANAAQRIRDVPYSDGDGNEGRRIWWDWPERVE